MACDAGANPYWATSFIDFYNNINNNSSAVILNNCRRVLKQSNEHPFSSTSKQISRDYKMATTFLAPAPKRTQSVDFSAPLLRFITNHYDVNSAEYKEAVSELNSLREATVVRTPDKHEAGLELICR